MTPPSTPYVVYVLNQTVLASGRVYERGTSGTAEEFGDSFPDARRHWVIDPIDGTKNFVRGVPVWGTLIALMIYDEPAVGVVSAPALGRRWWASLGGGAYAGKSLMSATAIHVSNVASIEDASLSYASISAWVESHQGQQFVDLLRR